MQENPFPVRATRRSILKGGGIAVVLLGINLRAGAIAQTNDHTRFDAWISVRADNTVILQVSQAEMGQGIHTTFPAVIAEEMDADWDMVTLELASHSPDYFNPNVPQMFTGNAESIRTFWPVLRKAGASVRDMMVRAAAARWSTELQRIETGQSKVRHPDGRELSYGELATEAASLTLNENPTLKNPDDWTILRKSVERRDLMPKITGSPIFGLDAEIEGMVFAAVRHADTPNGSVANINRQSIAEIAGVLDILDLPGAVAVVANATWPALRGAAELEVEFTPGPRDDFSSASLDELYSATLNGSEFTEVETAGNAAEYLQYSAPDVVSRDYQSAWQAHAPMEPMNCVADVQGDRAFILAPTQGQTLTMVRVAAALEIPEENVTVERTFLGGGFGRRLIADFAIQAALISKAVGKPVKLIWSRPEDMRNDYFRPQVQNRLSAVLGEDGLPIALDMKVVSPTILSPVIAKPLVNFVYPQIDPSCVEGMTQEGFLYDVPNYDVSAHILDVPLKTMVWRTTGYGPNVFAVECFIDELANTAKIDPIAYRLAMLRRTSKNGEASRERRALAERSIAVLEDIKDKAKWGSPIGMAQGVALSHCFDTIIAQVVDVSVDEDGTLDLHKVTTVLDGGYVLDPDITQANIEGGIFWGLTQALMSEITFEDGRVVQSNFDDFEILALPEAPPTELYWIDSGAKPGGLGEVGPVATAPALVNAVAAATERRVNSLPLSRHGIHTRYRKSFLPPDHALTELRS